jgi:hypothetical protein
LKTANNTIAEIPNTTATTNNPPTTDITIIHVFPQVGEFVEGLDCSTGLAADGGCIGGEGAGTVNTFSSNSSKGSSSSVNSSSSASSSLISESTGIANE